MSIAVLLVSLDLLGLVAIWLFVRARLNRALELENMVAEVRKEVRALNIELNETADRNISLVEDRMQALHGLLDEADRRMGIMRREIDNRASEREVYSKLGRRRPYQAEEAKEAPPRTEAAASTVGSRFEAPPAGFDEVRGAAGTEAPIRLELPRKSAEILPARESVIPPKTLREEAIELYRKGFSADIIAARLGATVAEIDLLVSLEEGRRGGEGS